MGSVKDAELAHSEFLCSCKNIRIGGALCAQRAEPHDYFPLPSTAAARSDSSGGCDVSQGPGSQLDLLSDLSDLDLVRHLLADLHDDLPEKIARFRMLADLGGQMGRSGTMIFGGSAAWHTWVEARSSFVHGNFVATVLLCQGLIEQLLAAYLYAGLLIEDLPAKIKFSQTLARCRERDIITLDDEQDLRRLMNLRNPLSHFRTINDGSHLERRSFDESTTPERLLEHDAIFAVGLAVRMLAKPEFRLE